MRLCSCYRQAFLPDSDSARHSQNMDRSRKYVNRYANNFSLNGTKKYIYYCEANGSCGFNKVTDETNILEALSQMNELRHDRRSSIKPNLTDAETGPGEIFILWAPL